MAGTEELYIGRRMASEVLEPTSAGALLGDTWDGTAAARGSREELELARRLTGGSRRCSGPAVERLHPGTVDPPATRAGSAAASPWLFLRPGRLDRDPEA